MLEESYVNTEPVNESELFSESEFTTSKISYPNTLIDIVDDSEFDLIENVDVESKEEERKESFKLPKLDISLCNANKEDNYDSLLNAPRSIETNVLKNSKIEKNTDTVQKKESWWRFW